MDSSFPDLLREHRVAAGLTQEALAERALLSSQAVGALERGDRRFPRRDTVVRIADALGLRDETREAFVAAAPSRSGHPKHATTRHRPQELPADTFGFIGRTGELAELDHGFTTAVVAVCGTAGVGKTALAVHWAHWVASAFPDGQLYMDLRGYDPDQPLAPAAALTALLRSLGFASADIPHEQAERANRYRTVLAERKMLVLLDNARDFEQIRDLLPGAPGSLAVVTSRDVLGELTVRHGAHRVTLDALTAADALRLLRVHIGPRVDAEPAAAAALVEQCARLPLALRIAAQLAATRPATTMATLAGELHDEQDRLALLDTGGPHGSAGAVLSWSYRHLPPAAARLFRLLAVHPGRHVDGYAAAALLDAPLGEARAVIATLARAHLLREVRPGRYDMHDLLRAYAASLPHDEPDAAARLSDYYVRAASAAMDEFAPFDHALRPAVPAGPAHLPAFGDRATALAWLDDERANLVAVGTVAHSVLFSRVLYRYLSIGAHYQEADALHAAALRASTLAERGDALVTYGVVLWRLGRSEEALTHYEEALPLMRAAGDRAGEARALVNQGVAYRWLGRHEEALACHRMAVEYLATTNDGWREARARDNLGLVHHSLGQYAEALAQQEHALALYRAADDPYGEAGVRSNLGVTCARLGRHAEALDHLERALASLRAVGDRRGEAETLNDLGTTLLALGQRAEAAERHRQALARADAIGDHHEHGRALEGLRLTR